MSTHAIACLCAICAPESTPSPIVQSAPAAVPDVELAQAMALFQKLDARGRALTFALMTAAVRLGGHRG